ncbi:MMPL family transporter [Massilia sp. YIM B02763]|uniref:MMPL family transporter n=1 Tax=Massilia sp. YIM B02763 TaxID=3050130 RepID=UPI0025B6EED6|nr:MMPL family transporter [Massilia sp. YIM B02763]MDN4051871.1 MMPL family transporter [Massilia sp. YIM B02763]
MTTQRRLALAWAFIVCLLLGHNAWLWLGQRIVPDTDILALLPAGERDPVLQQSFTHMVDSAQQRVVVLVGAPGWNDAVRAADAYAAVLHPHGALLRQDAVGDEAQAGWLAGLQPHATLLLAAADEAALRSRPAGEWTQDALARLYNAFSGPKLGAFRDDPFGLFANWMQERAGETPVRPREGRLFVAGEGRQYVLLTYTLAPSAFSLAAQRELVPLLDRATAAAHGALPAAEVIQAGVVLHAAAAGRQASGEVETIGVGSLLGIVLLTWLTFRSVKPITLVLLAIGIGFLGALSVCWLLFGRIHLLTLVFGASLIGVAQDYGFYFLCHRLGADARLDSPALLRRLLPGLGLTLLAAVIGYLGLALTPFPGLRHMAVFSALGLAFAWLTVVCWFPLLIGPRTLRAGWLVRRVHVAAARWPRLSARPPALATVALLAAIAAVGCARLGTNDDIRSLQSSPAHLVQDQIKLGRLLDAPTPVQYYLVRGASPEQVLQREEALKQRLDPLVAQGELRGVQALSNWVPSARTQARRLAALDTTLLAADGPLAALAQAVGEDDAWAEATRAQLRGRAAPLTPDAFLRTPASEPWRHLWLGEVDGVYASIVALRGMRYAAIPALARAADGIDGVQWVDKVRGISALLGRYRTYMGAVVLGAYVLVFAVLYPRYRGRTWRVLAPTAAASVLTLAVLGLTGQGLQLFHVLALMLLLGVGVDYGIFIQEDADKRDVAPWLAVGLSAASTLLSFGLLALSGTPALHAFGLTMLLGTALVWLAAPCFTITEKERHDTPVAA